MKNAIPSIEKFLIKALLIIVSTIVTVSVVYGISMVMGSRPSSVMIFIMFGLGIAYLTSQLYDQFVENEVDPISTELYDKLETQDKIQELILEELSKNGDISPEEIKVRAKVRQNKK